MSEVEIRIKRHSQREHPLRFICSLSYASLILSDSFLPQVMVLGMRAKGALPWMLDFVGNGPMFVPRPTYNPNPSAGLYHSRQVLSFDVTGPHRYLPMIHALKRHKVR